MASSQQQRRRGSQVLLLVAALALVFFIAAGSADAAYCSSPYTSCSGKCVNLKTDYNNCGYCGHVCKLSSDYKYGEVYCSGGVCYSRCKSGWKYNSSGKYCYQ